MRLSECVDAFEIAVGDLVAGAEEFIEDGATSTPEPNLGSSNSPPHRRAVSLNVCNVPAHLRNLAIDSSLGRSGLGLDAERRRLFPLSGLKRSASRATERETTVTDKTSAAARKRAGRIDAARYDAEGAFECAQSIFNRVDEEELSDSVLYEIAPRLAKLVNLAGAIDEEIDGLLELAAEEDQLAEAAQ
jgi:hypothetical protein